ncbi:hypothetical protein SASPL_137641 [Salvia splendens]|uniref:Uncharacterized protein n=1 Tax=Salvia splendens TaxID=180675 RepID=A0A8X8ZDM6_SALSN|nr:hypothetical protein SASPL_137641 [Salvia splendens]
MDQESHDQALSIAVENSANDSPGRVDIRTWPFSKRKGFKKMEVDSTKVDIYWDLSSAKFGSSPEPLEGFYLAIAINQEPCLLLGDSQTEAYKKMDIDPSPFAPKACFIARKEHIFGKRLYNSKAQFYRKVVLQVTHLQWKFRGNQTILVDGVCVEVYWDVHGWLFDTAASSAIFLFRTHVPVAKAGPLEGSENWQRLKESPLSHAILDHRRNPSFQRRLLRPTQHRQHPLDAGFPRALRRSERDKPLLRRAHDDLRPHRRLPQHVPDLLHLSTPPRTLRPGALPAPLPPPLRHRHQDRVFRRQPLPHRHRLPDPTTARKKVFINGAEIAKPDFFNNGLVVVHAIQRRRRPAPRTSRTSPRYRAPSKP